VKSSSREDGNALLETLKDAMEVREAVDDSKDGGFVTNFFTTLLEIVFIAY